MSITIVISTYGSQDWADLAWSRAYPSAADQQPDDIVVVHEPDLTIGPVRNKAAEQARTDWLVFLDADDELEPGYLDAMRHQLKGKSHQTTLFQPAVRYVRKGNHNATPFVRPAKDLRIDNYLVIGTMLKRRLFGEVGGFENYPHGFEDWSLWAKCWKAGASVIPVPEAVYRAHINPRSNHRQLWRNRQEQVRTHLRVQAELFPGGIDNWAR